MKAISQLSVSASLLTLLTLASSSFAAERVRHPHHMCQGNEAGTLSHTIGAAVVVTSEDSDTVHCPLLRLSSDSFYSRIRMRTSSGVQSNEISLREVNETGTLVDSHEASTSTVGSVATHTWTDIVPQFESQLAIQLVVANSDRVFSYEYIDGSFTLQ